MEAADAERQRLENSLHDGLQQHVLALSLRLRVARGRAEGELGTLLDEAIADALALNDELREFAREIYPSVLTERGLAAAIQAAATRARLPVHLRELPRRRYPELTEATAYFVVTAALAIAGLAGAAGDAEVTMADRPDGVSAEIRHPALADAAVSELHDRVAAAGGRLSLDGDVLRVELPG